MELILALPYVVKVLFTLFLILIINKISNMMTLSVFLGVVILAFLTGQGASASLVIAYSKLISSNTLFLLGVVFLVILLSSQMSESGVMKELVANIRTRVSQRNAMAILPAVIGLLPMPGGAIFSAPLVDDCDHNDTIDPILKVKINYWFRHLWEYWWPLYPGVLVAVDITGLPIVYFMAALFPMCLMAIGTGYFFLLRKVVNDESQVSGEKKPFNELLWLISPILTIIITYAIIKMFIPFIGNLNKYLPMIIGVLTALILLQVRKPLGLTFWGRAVFSKNSFKLVLLVALIMIYSAFIEAKLPDGSYLMTHMGNELSSWGISPFFVIILIPFIIGLTTGISVGFAGAGFPIVMSLLGVNPGLNTIISSALLAYVSGFMGVLLSPVHVCLIVTNEYFQTGLIKSLAKLFPVVLTLFGFGIGFYFLIINFL